MAKPLQPEPKFFLNDKLIKKGKAYYENTYFTHRDSDWLRGEKSVSYMESEKPAKQIVEYFPKAKIIFILRNPIERAISNYYYSVHNGLEKAPMEEAFLNEGKRYSDYNDRKISVSPFAYLKRGQYIDYISTYKRYFPTENLKVILYEKLIGSINVVHEIYTFLKVNAGFVPSAWHEAINKKSRNNFSLPPNLEHYLKNCFKDCNKRLEENFKLDISDWWQL